LVLFMGPLRPLMAPKCMLPAKGLILGGVFGSLMTVNWPQIPFSPTGEGL
jgi:hypothetical protein